MKTLLTVLLLALSGAALAVTIKAPTLETAKIAVRSPDDDVKTLGKVAY